MDSSVRNPDLVSPENPADGLIASHEWLELGRLFGLSDRERTVAQYVFGGHNREAIALKLQKPDGSCLSPETVRVYIDRILRRLKVSDRREMAIRILRVHRQIIDTAADC